MSQELEKRCRPIVRAVCEYWYSMKAGAVLDHEAVRLDLRGKLSELHESVEDDPSLKRELSRIELPLVFFIDYTMKESGFQFSSDWKEMARDYKEFSGDEKFFELLTDALDDPEGAEQLMMYYLFMGLGFDGPQTDRDYIERRMKVCATRFRTAFHPATDTLSSPDVMTAPVFKINRPNRFFTIYTMLLFSAGLLVAAFCYNLYVFIRETKPYKTALERAVSYADKYPDLTKQTPENPLPLFNRDTHENGEE